MEGNYICGESYKNLNNLCQAYLKDKKIDLLEVKIEDFINDDVLNRFISAREGDVDKAFSMWCKWFDWRFKYHPDKISESSISNELASGKAFFHGYDKDGRPCIIIKNKRHIPENTDFDEFMRFFIYLMETACKKSDETGTKQICLIMDRENTTTANFDRRVIGQMGLVPVLQDFYAERLHRVYILHVNWFFRSIFAMVKPFLSEKTKSKMCIINNTNELKNYFSDENLLEEHGGNSKFTYSYKKE